MDKIAKENSYSPLPATTTTAPTTAAPTTAAPTNAATKTAAPTTAAPATAAPTTAAPATAAPTNAATKTAAPTTAAPATAVPTTQGRITRIVIFKSNETFKSDLENSQSAAFKERAAKIKSELEPKFKQDHPNFESLEAIQFRNGSIFNVLAIIFTSLPVNDTLIGQTLINAAATVSGFDIDTTSIILDGMVLNSGVSHNISLVTASFLVLFSWILSSQQ
ncbi:integumentary mucin C.1-like [Centropristis striata]|uniref:integumentary mucin C.1-like n=1 Tax=Centropristis striata TaxID=184440 RepID=UPI0027DFEA3E|nr:integumentary mucin C.1-like [Centropristis striata]